MKKSLIIILCTFASISMMAQGFKKDLVEADSLFSHRRYNDALAIYLPLQKNKSLEVDNSLRIANIYYELNEFVSAETWYDVAFNKEGELPSADFKKYLQAILVSGNVEKAKDLIMERNREKIPPAELVNIMQSLVEYSEYLKDSILYEVTRASISTNHAEFGPFYVDGNLVYTAGSKTGLLKVGAKNIGNNQYVDLFIGQVDRDDYSNVFEPKKLSKKLNGPFNDGPAAFYNGFSSIVYSKTNKKGEGEILTMGLYFSSYDSSAEEWTKPTAFKHNNPNFNFTHPAINQAGDTLIFSSDRQGGRGRGDLYISRMVDGQWTKPKNLGGKVNTKEKELFPSILEDQLFFASNGHPGLGGLDIYRIAMSKLFEEEPYHLNSPINSQADDFAITYYKNKKQGYFSSNRFGTDDIFAFEKQYKKLSFSFLDSLSRSQIDSVEIVVYHPSDTLKQNPIMVTKRENDILLPIDTLYAVELRKPGYRTKSIQTKPVLNEKIDLIMTRDISILDHRLIFVPVASLAEKAFLEIDGEMIELSASPEELRALVKDWEHEKITELLASTDGDVLGADFQAGSDMRIYNEVDLTDMFSNPAEYDKSEVLAQLSVADKIIKSFPYYSLEYELSEKSSEGANAVSQSEFVDGVLAAGILDSNIMHPKDASAQADNLLANIRFNDTDILFRNTSLAGDISFKIMLGAFRVYREQDYAYLKDLGVSKKYMGPKTGLTIYYINDSDYALSVKKRETVKERGIDDAVVYFYYKGEFKWVHQIIEIIKETDKGLLERLRKDYNKYYKWYDSELLSKN